MALDSREWLVWLGIKSPQTSMSQIDLYVQLSKQNIGDYTAFQDGVNNQTSYSEWDTYLGNNGFSTSEADNFVSLVKKNFSDEDSSGTTWDEYTDYVVNQTDTYQQFKSGFGSTQVFGSSSTTQEGEPAAGIRVHESASLSYDGVSIPAGTVEVFGQRVEFSQQEAPASATDITFSNLTTNDADNTVNKGQSITISADASNSNSYQLTVTVPYLEDGEVVRTKDVTINANTTKTVSFTVTKDEYVCVDAAIADLSPITVCWKPASMT